MYLSAYIISAFWRGCDLQRLSNPWVADVSLSGRVCDFIFSFSIRAFKADHVWEMISDGLVLCCALRKPAPSDTSFLQIQTFQENHGRSLLNLSPCWASHLRLHGKGGGRNLPLLFPPVFLSTSFILFFPFVLQFEPNPCMLNCHTTSALLNGDINSQMKCTKSKGHFSTRSLGSKTAHLFQEANRRFKTQGCIDDTFRSTLKITQLQWAIV